MKRWIPFLISVAHFVALMFIARQHPYGNCATETDFYHLYAPDAERLAAGQFPANTFQGPGYPATIALIAKMTSSADLFTVGKWLSVISAVICGLLVFKLFSDLFNYRVGIWAQLLVAVSGEFPQFSINATTDIFFLAVCLLVLVVFSGKYLSLNLRIALSGALTGFAFVTRYNGLYLLAACLMGIVVINQFERPLQARLKLSAVFLIAFLVAASPWLIANYRHHGSPLYNTNYLNMATEFYPELVAGKTNQDGTRVLEEKFKSFGDVLRFDYRKIVKRYPANLVESLKSIIREDLMNRWVAWLSLAGLALALIYARSKSLLTILTSGALYLLLMGLNHWEARYYFFVMVLCVGLAVFALDWLFESASSRLGMKQPFHVAIPLILFTALWGMSLAESRADVIKFLSAQPREIIAARDFLNSVNPQGRKLRIVARKPHLPYMSHNEWIFFPPVKTIEEFRAWVETNNVDYIAIGKREIKERRELAPLANSKKAPEWLSAEWVSDDPPFILYKPVRR